MTRQKSFIGMEIDCTARTIEAFQLKRVRSTFSHPNLSSQKPHEQKNEDVFLPPFLLGNLINLPAIYKTLGLNINNVLLSRESIITHRALSVGNSITIRTFLKDAYEQQASSNPIGFIVLESVGIVDKTLAFYAERVIAVRGGFHRGRS